MFQYLQFKNLNGIEIKEPTKNTIMLCNNKDLVFRIAREFECLIDELVTGYKHDNIDYALNDFKKEIVKRYKGDNIRLTRAIKQGKFGCYEKYGL